MGWAGHGSALAPRCGLPWHGWAPRAGYLRHDNHAEVQPVPRVPQEGEGIQAEASRQDLDQRLKGVNGSEGVPGEERAAAAGPVSWCPWGHGPWAATGLSAMLQAELEVRAG